MKRILILCKSAVGTAMSSPGIRATNMARVLAHALPESTLTLGVDGPCDLPPQPRYAVRPLSGDQVRALIRQNDVVISQGFPSRALASSFGRTLILDFFTNFMIEGLEYRAQRIAAAQRESWLESQRRYLNLQLTLADYVICANERQRDTWLGMMSSLGLITGDVYDRDPTLRSLVAVCPYGVRATAPLRRHRVLKGVYPGIGANDRLLLWNGGILRYYDPESLIHAFRALLPANPDLKLLFLGNRYPVVGFDIGDTLGKAIGLARALGLEGQSIFFNDGWLPFEDSGDAMLEADLGVSTYYDTLETHLSYRTRLVDFIWAGLPFVCTRGDLIAEQVQHEGLGLTVTERDVAGLTAALHRLLNDEALRASCRAALESARERMTWERQMAPLVDLLRRNAPVAQSKSMRGPMALLRTAQYLNARTRESGQQRLRNASFSVLSSSRLPPPG
ncbi:MAG: glycosyltransferase family 4 protein [Dehalococcoidia bacterium]